MGMQFYPFKTGQQTVTSTATLIVPASGYPNTSGGSNSGIQITQLGGTDVWLGENANVTSSTGHLLLGTKGASVSFSTTGAIYGITASGSSSVSYLVTQ